MSPPPITPPQVTALREALHTSLALRCTPAEIDIILPEIMTRFMAKLEIVSSSDPNPILSTEIGVGLFVFLSTAYSPSVAVGILRPILPTLCPTLSIEKMILSPAPIKPPTFGPN